ncbi:hypothetical protein JTB14_009460 [Gonioctena quinquepunctata]|nr:hypothetical protein JTB14_009460 [Gonioctena quinquepunctata]
MCYYCPNSNPFRCNDPIDVTELIPRNCSSAENSFTGNERIDNGFVCLKMISVINGAKITTRKCSQKLYGTMDTCTFETSKPNAKDILLNTENVACSTCHMDLCNGNPAMRLSASNLFCIILTVVILQLYC